MSEIKDVYISIMFSDGEYYITTDHRGIISAFISEKAGIESYKNLYTTWNRNTTFQPSIVRISGVDEIKKIVGDDPRLFNLSYASGYITGIRIPDKKIGEEFWNKGAKPQFIKE